MAWKNSPVRLFHGTDDVSADEISRTGVDLSRCQPLTDFGTGFYTTTHLDQAKNWANLRTARLRLGALPNAGAAVIAFEAARTGLAGLKSLNFVRDDADYWAFVRYCRTGGRLHGPGGAQYDVVSGPVSLWSQKFVISGCDQFSFHTDIAVKQLGPVRKTLAAPVKTNRLFRILK